jgi:hypothetical protein
MIYLVLDRRLRVKGGPGCRKQTDRMSLRKSPIRTPALLAANRANAQKCTGPRTREAKGRVALNALEPPTQGAQISLAARQIPPRLGRVQRLYRALYVRPSAGQPDEAAMAKPGIYKKTKE